MKTALFGIEIFVAVVLIVILAFQVKGGGVSGIFGGGGASSTFRSRRGIERTLFRLTIALAVVFVVIAAAIVTF
jgi:preprotein translocase subunit SecG